MEKTKALLQRRLQTHQKNRKGGQASRLTQTRKKTDRSDSKNTETGGAKTRVKITGKGKDLMEPISIFSEIN